MLVILINIQIQHRLSLNYFVYKLSAVEYDNTPLIPMRNIYLQVLLKIEQIF